MFLCLENSVPHHPKFLIDRKAKLVLYKTNNMLKAYPLYCTHMGASLVTDDVFNKKCKFHGLCNHEIALFVHKSGATLRQDTQNLLLLDKVITKSDLFHYSSIESTGNFTQKMWMENVLDFNHVEYVHKNTLAKSFEKPGHYDELLLYKEGDSYATTKVNSKNIRGLLKRVDIPEENRFFKHAVIGKNLSITSFCDVFFSVERVEDGVARTHYLVIAELKEETKFLSYVYDQNKKLLQEDVAMLNTIDHDSYNRGTLLRKIDNRIAHFRTKYA